MSVMISSAGPSYWDEAGDTLKLGAPLVLTQVATVLISATNVAIAGGLGRTELATVSLATSIYYTVFMFCLGVGTAVAPMVAQAVGRKLRWVRDVRRTTRQGFWVVIAVGLPGAAILWQADPILRLLGQDPALTPLSGAYARVLAIGLLPWLGFVVMRNFVTALSRTRIVLLITVFGTFVNAAFGYGLAHGVAILPNVGVNGIATATALTGTAMFLGMLAYAYIDRDLRRLHLLGRFWRSDWRRFVGLIKLGVPIGVTVVLEVGLFSSAVLFMGRLGTNQLAAHQIALQLVSTAFMVPLGMSQAVSVRVGMAAGADDAAWVARAGWTGIGLGTAFVMVSALLFWFMPEPLIGLFIDRHDAANDAVVALGISYLAIGALFQGADALQALAAGALRGLRDTRVPMVVAAIGYWGVGFPVAWVLAFYTTANGQGVWIGLASGLAVVAVALTWRFARRRHYALGPLH